MIKPLAALVVGVAALSCAGGAAADVFYPTLPYQTVNPPPPLASGGSALRTGVEHDVPFGSHITGRAAVDVGIGPDGAPVAVTATQRLRIDGTGDYSFVVPAPATSVARGAGSDSLPGLREVGIVWQGFSNRHRLLSARATLHPRPAAKGLPLRLLVSRRDGATVVRLVNVATRRLPVLTGRARRRDLAGFIRRLRAAGPQWPYLGQLAFVRGRFGRTTHVDVTAPLHVTGTISAHRVDALLGAGRRGERTFVVRGSRRATLRLRVELPPQVALLPSRATLLRARQPVRTLQLALATAAVARAYGRYLDTPDQLATSETSYHYRSVARPAAARAAPLRRGGGSDTLTIALVASLGAVGLAGVAAVWARS